MKTLFFDCSSGISGNMTLGALLELVGDEIWFLEQIEKLSIWGYQVEISKRESHGISGTFVDVRIDSEDDALQCSGDCHVHIHRNLQDIEQLIRNSSLELDVKDLAIEIFRKVAVAEAKVHGKPIEQVHFHEVGAIDSIIDIVGTAILIRKLNPDRICASVLNEGHGFIDCQHGRMAVPVPATVEILANAGIPFRQVDVETEMITPTGAAIIATLAEEFGNVPAMKLKGVGYGVGSREIGYANALKVYVGESISNDEIYVIETNIDDATGEEFGYTMERLLEAGAKDAFYTPIFMKKNRPAYQLTVLCEQKKIQELQEIIFCETTTIGVRYYPVRRTELMREMVEMQLPEEYAGERIRCKKVTTEGGKTFLYPEYEDMREMAKKTGKSIKEIRKLVH
ncbi:MAG: nickel pincer cofactor biosynthesis protein LarC [Lachnospiraceae bacterium]|nr:nickel pincer cofactor biosynthesis protein LarC [Lachnospiraceae bacterium]